jgi:L-amino acid N-acyltransferase YncA
MCRRRYDILAKGLPWLVAVSDGTVAFYAYAGRYRPGAAYRDTVENSIYMCSDFIGRGDTGPPSHANEHKS